MPPSKACDTCQKGKKKHPCHVRPGDLRGKCFTCQERRTICSWNGTRAYTRKRGRDEDERSDKEGSPAATLPDESLNRVEDIANSLQLSVESVVGCAKIFKKYFGQADSLVGKIHARMDMVEYRLAAIEFALQLKKDEEEEAEGEDVDEPMEEEVVEEVVEKKDEKKAE